MQLTANTTFTVLGESQTLQRLCLVPTTKTSRTHGTEVILFISHQGRVQLGYADTFPMDGIVLLQYKLPHVHCQGVPVELLLPPSSSRARTTFPKSTLRTSLSPSRSSPLPTDCPGTHRDPKQSLACSSRTGIFYCCVTDHRPGKALFRC